MNEGKGILLETGTNEFEVVEFEVGGVCYGINVAKVREVIKAVPVTSMAQANPSVEGIFTLRGKVMPLVSLRRRLGLESSANSNSGHIIVTEINGFSVGFKVDEVRRIHRISWGDMEQPPVIAGSELAVGIIKMQDKLIILIDFERILAEINPEVNRRLTEVEKAETNIVEERRTKTILVAEDSQMLRAVLDQTLGSAGYERIVFTENGKYALDTLLSMADGDGVSAKIDAIITDIEMPQMDGHHLVKRIKEDERFKHLPTIIFSSLINDEMRKKGEAVGADAQVTKPEAKELISFLDKFVLASK